MPHKRLNIKVGDVFGRLTVRELLPDKWTLCECSCGNFKKIRIYSLTVKTRPTLSCCCLRDDVARTQFLKHGKSHSREWDIYCAMKRRCLRPKAKDYKDYGGRGISICESWLLSFSSFYADMKDAPVGMSIERRDNNGPYSPDNCYWASMIDQGQNKRNNVNLTAFGITKTVAAWARHLGIKPGGIYKRKHKGMSDEACLSVT